LYLKLDELRLCGLPWPVQLGRRAEDGEHQDKQREREADAGEVPEAVAACGGRSDPPTDRAGSRSGHLRVLAPRLPLRARASRRPRLENARRAARSRRTTASESDLPLATAGSRRGICRETGI
jgi:hypothetical protein